MPFPAATAMVRSGVWKLAIATATATATATGAAEDVDQPRPTSRTSRTRIGTAASATKKRAVAINSTPPMVTHSLGSNLTARYMRTNSHAAPVRNMVINIQ